MTYKVAISKEGSDLLRIVPLRTDKNETYELKIIPLSERYFVKAYKLFNGGLYKKLFNGNNMSITYHVSNKSNQTKIHVIDNEKKYVTLPIQELIDLNHNFDYPIPLLKMHIPSKESKQTYKKKVKHVPFDMGDNNYAEIYLMSSKSKIYSTFLGKQIIEHLLSIPFEYLATNIMTIDPSKIDFIQNGITDEGRKVMVRFPMNNDIDLIICFYKSKIISSEETYTFIENTYSKDILLMTQMIQRDLDKNTNEYSYVDMKGISLAEMPSPLFPLTDIPISEHSFANFYLKKLDRNSSDYLKLQSDSLEAQLKIRQKLLDLERNQ